VELKGTGSRSKDRLHNYRIGSSFMFFLTGGGGYDEIVDMDMDMVVVVVVVCCIAKV